MEREKWKCKRQKAVGEWGRGIEIKKKGELRNTKGKIIFATRHI